ncbi:MAG: histone deacetylase [Candidatus Aminicenantes bacterium]|nr:histone deacetylase [Candidatus Aminicenantes bacterium]
MAILKSIFGFLKRGYPFKFVYSDSYWMVDIGTHLFPLRKYRLIYEKLLISGVNKTNFITPHPASEEDILRVHTAKYMRKLRTGRLSHSETLALEIPYSPEMFDFACLHVGGTIAAAETALEEGLAVHIGGGFHHAFAGHGEGFCILNDVAVAAAKLLDINRIGKVLVVDCDVHQGNGTASIFSGRDSVFTLSIHQMDLYPADKPEGDLDIGLWSGDGDEKYISVLREHFPRIYEQFAPDLIFYLAGADPYEKDQLGGLRVTKEGLNERGRIVIGEALRLRIPLAVLLAGGYAFDVEDTVQIHLQTIETARRFKKKYR